LPGFLNAVLNEKRIQMNNERINPLQKILQGAGLIFLGQICGFILQFVCGIIVIRYLSQSDYGIFTLCLTIISIAVVISSIGMENGLPRMMAQYVAENDDFRLNGTIKSAYFMTFCFTAIILVSLYIGAGPLSRLFDKQDLSWVMRIMCFLIPAHVFINLTVSLYRGYEYAAPKVLFQDITPSFLRLVAYIIVVAADFGFNGILQSQIIIFYLTICFFLFYAKYRLRNPLSAPLSRGITRSLLKISFPVLGITLLNMVMLWTTILFVGYFKPSEDVAIYSAAMRLVDFLPLPLLAIAYTYLPIATKLHAEGQQNRLNSLYSAVTRWCCLVSLPIAFVLIVDAEFVLKLLFGNRYLASAEILRILCLGYLFHAFLGPNAMTLLALGRTYPMIVSSLIGATINSILCIVLIPIYGISGAAIALSFSLISMNLMISAHLYLLYSIHPLSRKYFVPIIMVLFIMVIMGIISSIFPLSLMERIPIYILIVLASLSAPVITGSICDEDRTIFDSMKKRSTA
jgi:O-antigen/teichoic acid export membrane protein